MTWLAGALVILAGCWLVGLALLIFLAPNRADRFLMGFASSLRVHVLEQALRIVAGSALILYADHMRFTTVFWAFGWVLIVTSVGLLLLPWRWHQAFGTWAIPLATRHLTLYGLGSLALGGFVLFSVVWA